MKTRTTLFGVALVAVVVIGGWFLYRTGRIPGTEPAARAGSAGGGAPGSTAGVAPGSASGANLGPGAAGGADAGGPASGRSAEPAAAARGPGAGGGGAGGSGGGPGSGRAGGRPGGPGFDPNRAAPVQAAVVRKGSIDIAINAIGTVTARNTATVRSRVDGLLLKVLFREGQTVKAGDVLAEIDPRPYQVLLDQMQGQLVRDQALLANAKVDLDRYRGLLSKDSIAKQQVDAQVALVRQYEGTVLADKGQVDSAKLQVTFTRITAPLSGRLGLRQVDVGNMVHASDTTGLVVITETQPITAVFSIPADNLPPVMRRLGTGDTLAVEALSADGKTSLANGKLLTVDNQIDTTTGTVKLKAEFPNKDNSLFPNQFINARLVVETRPDVILMSSAAVQRGSEGTFVYRVDEGVVKVVPVKLGTVSGGRVEVLQGLQPGDQVVFDGVDRLRDGAKVEVIQPQIPTGDSPRRRRRDGAGGPGGANGAPAAAAPGAPGATGAPGASSPSGAAGSTGASGAAGTPGPTGAGGRAGGSGDGSAAQGERRARP